MKAVILAAGAGKRMLPLTRDIPKPLLRIGNQPVLDYIFEALPEEIDMVIVVVGYLKDRIKTYLGAKYYGKEIRYIYQAELTGTATALLAAKELFQKNERFIVIYGDELPTKTEIQDCLRQKYSWLCSRSSNPCASGIVEVDDNNIIRAVVEKPENPQSDMGVAGIMVVDSSIFNYLPKRHQNGEYYLTSLMDNFLKDKSVCAIYGRSRPPFLSPDEIAKIDPITLKLIS